MRAKSGAISHVVLYVYDFLMMKNFYTNVLGFHLSDIGQGRGADICFLTLDPELDHHQIALSGGRKGPRDAGRLNHVAFRVGSLTELRRRYVQLSAEDTVTDEHGAFTVSGFGPGECSAIVSATGYRPTRLSFKITAAGEPAALTVQLQLLDREGG